MSEKARSRKRTGLTRSHLNDGYSLVLASVADSVTLVLAGVQDVTRKHMGTSSYRGVPLPIRAMVIWTCSKERGKGNGRWAEGFHAGQERHAPWWS